MKYIISLLFVFSSFPVFSQNGCSGVRHIYFYGDDGILLDSSNKETRKYKINISMVDCDGNKVDGKKYKLSKEGIWGGYFDNSPITLFIQFIRGRDTMHVTLRKIFSNYMVLNGIYFLKGKYAYSDFKVSDTIPDALVSIQNWWSYNVTANKVYPKPLYVKGLVTNLEDYPLVGVSIQVKNSLRGTVTDSRGILE